MFQTVFFVAESAFFSRQAGTFSALYVSVLVCIKPAAASSNAREESGACDDSSHTYILAVAPLLMIRTGVALTEFAWRVSQRY